MATLKSHPPPWRGLAKAQATQLKQAIDWLARGDTLMSGQLLLDLQRSAPEHAEVQRWAGLRHLRLGEWALAAAALEKASRGLPRDFGLWCELAKARDASFDFVGAGLALQSAAACATTAAHWLALSEECDRQGQLELALSSVERALALEPAAPVARLQRVRCCAALGRAEQAAADCRALIAAGQLGARAWFSLVDLKTVPLDAAELEQLRQAAGAASLPVGDRMLLDFACGRALEDAGRLAEALVHLQAGNAAARAGSPWDARAFDAEVQAVRSAFEAPGPVAQPQGREVVFLVGMPRSGSTLVEQVLASHSMLEGASELPYLKLVIDEESQRRGAAFPRWVPQNSADDWTRLGRHYLALSARWRSRRPIATDKLPENWLLAGAALRMLPEARVVDCRRDALETCWSCYRQLFAPQRVGFTYDFGSLAAYWRACTDLGDFWVNQQPQRYRVQTYEALVREPEVQIRALLAFCDLPFEAACLAFHATQRAIRTASALQVRQPLSGASVRAAHYGSLLDPLRSALALPPA